VPQVLAVRVTTPVLGFVAVRMAEVVALPLTTDSIFVAVNV
jgi:hypothetical protein